ncbi:MAG: murein hydrolase activator EnvC family protein, partial [Acidimicrobiales bacterium]
LILGVAAPAHAETVSDARRRQEQVRKSKASAASKLKSAKASDVELEKAVDALANQVRAQNAKVSTARQAVAAAEKAVADADVAIEATETRIGGLHRAVVKRAVASYIRPQREAFAEFTNAKDLGEAGRRRAILAQVVSNDRDLIDQLRAAKEDLGVQKAAAESARGIAAERRQAVEGQLRSLQTSLADKARLQSALDTRIAEIQSEIDGLASQDAAIANFIRQKEQAARASRSSSIDTGGRVSGAGLIWPVRGTVTSEYGYRWGRQHAGIDISASTGTPIGASKAGIVIYSGSMSGYGNVVIVDHGGGFSTLYAHQSRLAVGDGASVSQGEVVGYVGNTGRSTGPHLHFETRVNGDAQNPRRYLP